MFHQPFLPCDCTEQRCGCSRPNSFAAAYSLLLALVKPKLVFEWGPGLSTRIALAAGARVLAVEPNPAWAACQEVYRHLAITVAPVGSLRYLHQEGQEEADLFFVDCRERAACLDRARDACKPSALVCLHDAQRLRYREALARWPFVAYLERGFAVASKVTLPFPVP